MFEVLVFVYEHYWRGDACPELQQLGRRLSAHGFEPDEIHDALVWLDGLTLAAQSTSLDPAEPQDSARAAAAAQSLGSMRVYSVAEQDHLGAQCLGFVIVPGILGRAARRHARDRDRPRDGRAGRSGV